MKKLNFGCGKIIKKGWVNVDGQKAKGIDKSFDFEKFPYPLKANEFDYILLDNVFEHLINLNDILDELHRISKKGAVIEIIVPYYNCSGAYNDVTHVNFFNKVSIINLITPHVYYSHEKRKKEFKIVELTLVPTRLGKLFPKFMREKVSFILAEIYSDIKVKIKVIK